MIKFDKEKMTWEVSVHRRHPITRLPKSLRRIAKTEGEAKRLESKLKREIEEAFLKTTSPGWKCCVDELLGSMQERGLTEHSIHDYGSVLKSQMFKCWSNKRITDITTQQIRELVTGKTLELRSMSHKKNVLKFIRAVFNQAVQAGYVQRNPTPDIRFKIGDKIRVGLTEDQVIRFLRMAKEMNTEWYPVWAMAVFTGMRNGELFALRWQNVDLEQRMIRVTESWNSKDGFKSTKSGDDRILEIPLPLIDILRGLKLTSAGSPFVLPRVDKWDRGEQARELRMFLSGMGLPSIRFHDLRATWATLLLSKGVEPIRVMSAGGWKDLKTMMIYCRKAGISIKGMSSVLDHIHDPKERAPQVLTFPNSKSGTE